MVIIFKKIKKKKFLLILIALFFIFYVFAILNNKEEFDVKYTKDYNFKIPEDVMEFSKEGNNRGKAYLLSGDRKSTIYLDYATGNNLGKPKILNINHKDGVAIIYITKPNDGGVALINPHYFTVSINENIEDVRIIEMNNFEYYFRWLINDLELPKEKEVSEIEEEVLERKIGEFESDLEGHKVLKLNGKTFIYIQYLRVDCDTQIVKKVDYTDEKINIRLDSKYGLIERTKSSVHCEHPYDFISLFVESKKIEDREILINSRISEELKKRDKEIINW